MFGIFASIAEFEQELIRERARSGIAAARARGKRLGRPRRQIDPSRVAAMRSEACHGATSAGLASALRLPEPPFSRVRKTCRNRYLTTGLVRFLAVSGHARECEQGWNQANLYRTPANFRIQSFASRCMVSRSSAVAGRSKSGCFPRCGPSSTGSSFAS